MCQKAWCERQPKRHRRTMTGPNRRRQGDGQNSKDDQKVAEAAEKTQPEWRWRWKEQAATVRQSERNQTYGRMKQRPERQPLDRFPECTKTHNGRSEVDDRTMQWKRRLTTTRQRPQPELPEWLNGAATEQWCRPYNNQTAVAFQTTTTIGDVDGQ